MKQKKKKHFLINKLKTILQVNFFCYRNNAVTSPALRTIAVSLTDSVDLRVVISVLYIITEVMREESKSLDDSIYKHNVESFKEELSKF